MAMAAASHDVILRTLLQGYQHPDAARTDLNNALQTFKDLKPQKNDFVFNDGTLKKLICLDGTIPILYKGNTYNIPVVIWLMEAHPYAAPMAFVVPTSTMSIRPGRSVDSDGAVRLAYLSEWHYPSSDTTGLLRILAQAFSETPPVFSKQPSRPPPPVGGGTQMPFPSPTTAVPPPGGQAAGPSGHGLPYPGGASVGASGHQLPYPIQQPVPGIALPYQAMPSMPVPGVYQQPMPAMQSSSYNPAAAAGYGSASAAGAGVGQSQQQLPYPQMPAPYGASSSGASYANYPGAMSPYPMPGVAGGIASAVTAGYPSSSAPVTNPYLSDEQVKMSIKSAVEDKIRWKLREKFAQASAEMDVLRKVQEELTAGQQHLSHITQMIADEQKEVEKTKKYFQEKIDEMKSLTLKLDSRDRMDPEDIVVTTAPLYKQLLTAFAEEQAIEDVLYCLGEGLRKSVVDLDGYLKKVRELSRRQFLLRALMQKCREKANLSDVYGC